MNMLETIVKTTYNGKEEKEVIENVMSIFSLNDKVAVNFKDNDGRFKTQYLTLDGYTDLIIR